MIAAAQSRSSSVPAAAPPVPPFRADHIGSLLRPAALSWARSKAEAGAISTAELERIEDLTIADAVAL